MDLTQIEKTAESIETIRANKRKIHSTAHLIRDTLDSSQGRDDRKGSLDELLSHDGGILAGIIAKAEAGSQLGSEIDDYAQVLSARAKVITSRLLEAGDDTPNLGPVSKFEKGNGSERRRVTGRTIQVGDNQLALVKTEQIDEDGNTVRFTPFGSDEEVEAASYSLVVNTPTEQWPSGDLDTLGVDSWDRINLSVEKATRPVGLAESQETVDTLQQLAGHCQIDISDIPPV